MKIIISILLIVIDFTMANAQKEFINPFPTKPSGYTHVVVVNGSGKTIYISGQVPVNSHGEVVGKGDIQAQTVQVYENLKIALQAAGASFNDVVKMNTYIVNYKPEQVAIVRAVRSNYLSKENPPASTLVGVQALVNPDFLIEIEAVAFVK